MHIMAIMHIIAIISFISDCFLLEWLESVGSRVVYELDYKKPILYVIPIQSILGKLPLVPVGDTGTIPHSMHNAISGAPGDRRPGAGDGCWMWFVNSWAWGAFGTAAAPAPKKCQVFSSESTYAGIFLT
jgi:hypothetical protein